MYCRRISRSAIAPKMCRYRVPSFNQWLLKDGNQTHIAAAPRGSSLAPPGQFTLLAAKARGGYVLTVRALACFLAALHSTLSCRPAFLEI